MGDDVTIVLGVEIGENSGGWDEVDDYAIVIYNFKPNAAFQHACPQAGKCDLIVHFEEGIFAVYMNDGSSKWEAPIIDVMYAVKQFTAAGLEAKKHG